jgi:hypothetical protein
MSEYLSGVTHQTPELSTEEVIRLGAEIFTRFRPADYVVAPKQKLKKVTTLPLAREKGGLQRSDESNRVT